MRRAGGIAVVALLLIAAFTLGLSVSRSPDGTPTLLSERADRDTPGHLIDEVRQELAVGYYRTVDSSVLAQPTIAEILEALGDPHTDYLTPKEYEALKSRIARSYAGVGLNVGPAKAGLRVTSAVSGPARRAGIRRGDLIVSVNGRPTRDLGFQRSLALIKGVKRTAVRLTVRRRAVGTIRFTVVRGEISMPTLRWRLVVHERTRLAYVRVLSFRESTAEQLEDRLGALLHRGAKGVVLDLRGNPGGLVAEAVDAASVFLEDGVVCTTADEHHEVRVLEVIGEAAYPRIPVMVLVDRGTASAAEIVAAALFENGRAALLGERTFGKASVQSLRPLSNGGALKLTTATYQTPAGNDLDGRGVVPALKARDNPKTSRDEGLAAAEKALLEQLA
jgi:carboxyl-terminal processing protease